MKDDEIWSIRYLLYSLMPSHYIWHDKNTCSLYCFIFYLHVKTTKRVSLRSEFVNLPKMGSKSYALFELDTSPKN